MVKVRVNVFGHIGSNTRTVAWSRKVEVIAINDPFIHFNYMVYMLQYDSTHDKFNSTVKTENEKQSSESPLKDTRCYTEDQVVSYDFYSDSHSYTFDAGDSIALNDNTVKLIS
ncbi:glyceraldehyde-3-phosphate dehydrogenase-like [Alexandromys fortis]|uniref:glyceraldehyde-3-phosphate dehydrogenase-like n=1 Tax=Alexandromys fortis TaxID=100897 RepID=UPI00215336AA|nr:glyceraldehyde-3-phosphate dehydrogenase-like [Microtus fortis]